MKRTEAALPGYGASHLSKANILLRIELSLSDHQCAHPAPSPGSLVCYKRLAKRIRCRMRHCNMAPQTMSRHAGVVVWSHDPR
jgi:hypothetical protein